MKYYFIMISAVGLLLFSFHQLIMLETKPKQFCADKEILGKTFSKCLTYGGDRGGTR